MRLARITLLLIPLIVSGAGLLPAKDKKTSKASAPSSDMSQLWNDPGDIGSRDLLLGPGGSRNVPRPDVEYQFKELDKTGHSKGYIVKDPDGRVWKAKIGEEAQAEIAVSRILWAIGYHQPVLHYVEKWKMTGGPADKTEPARFRLESDHEKGPYWSWTKNPFAGTRQLKGLIIADTLLNNWDLTPSNNRIFKPKEPGGGPATWYVDQDVGGSLGKTRWPLGTRNNIEDYESQRFIESVKDGRVQFDYHSRHGNLLRDITPEDVVWTCRLLAKLSDKQLTDAFHAGHYTDDLTQRFVRKIKSKIQEGLALEGKGGKAGAGR